MPYPCGQCMCCRINKRREWQHRMILESHLHTHNSFWTLTYSDSMVPTIRNDLDETLQTLSPLHLQLWLKRLRKALSPVKVRFFAVGEYGDQTQRPHYHVILFGYPSCHRGNSRFSMTTGKCCPQCDLINETWGLGQVFGGTAESDSFQYVAGYTIKKMTHAADLRLNGRHPEFTRSSRRPGIGHDYIPEIASTLLQFDLETTEADVPVSLRHGMKQLPLGRYMRRKLREHIGKDPKAPETVLNEAQAELSPLRQAAFNDSSSFKEAVKAVNKGQTDRAESRARIFKPRKSI